MIRDFENTPRPNVEHHYHIEELIKAQGKRSDDRQQHKDRIATLEQRDALIKDAKGFTVKEFFCVICNVDFISEAVKQVEVDWTNTMQNIAFYKTKCFKGHWCIRLITDTQVDPYWMKSIKIARDRGKHFADLLQPFETGYNLLYGKK